MRLAVLQSAPSCRLETSRQGRKQAGRTSQTRLVCCSSHAGTPYLDAYLVEPQPYSCNPIEVSLITL